MSAILEFLKNHQTEVLAGAGFVVETFMRLYPSDKIRSIFSYVGKICTYVGKISFAINDFIAKVIPDNRAK